MGSLWVLLLLSAVPAPGADAGIEVEAERLTLQQSVDRAMNANVTLVTAQAEARRAEALVEQVRAASLPTLYGNGLYTRLDHDRTLPDGTVVASKNQLSANLQLTVPLVSPHNWAQWSRAADNANAARASAADVRRTIAVSAARAYLTIISQRRVVEVTERARDTAIKHLNFAQARLQGGVGNRVDVVRADQEVKTDASQLEIVRINLARAREALGIAINSDRPVDAADDGQLPDPPQPESAISDALSLRTDLKAAEVRSNAAERSANAAWTDYLPLLSLVAQPFAQTPAPPTFGYQAQLILSLPFYDGGLRYGQQHERVALKAEAQVALEGTLRQTRSDVRVAFEAVKHADDGLQASRSAAQLAEEALKLTTLAYQNGATTNLEVIDAERRARDAATDAAVAEDTARQARLELLSASGHFP